MSKRLSRLLSPVPPECEREEDQSRSRMFDQIQREAEQELQNAEKVLLAADSVVGETRYPTRGSEAGRRSTGKRDYHHPSQTQLSSKYWPRRGSETVPGTQGQSTGYPTSGRAHSTVRPTNTPDYGSRKVSGLSGPRTFPFHTPLTSEVFYASVKGESERDKEPMDFKSKILPVGKEPTSRSRETSLKDSKINRGVTSSRYKSPCADDDTPRVLEFEERDEYLSGKKASSSSRENEKFYSTKCTSNYTSCFTRMPWEAKENEDRYNCSRYDASKNLGSFSPLVNTFPDYNFEFGTRAKGPPEYLTGGSPYFQETNEPTSSTPSTSFLNPTSAPTTPPPSAPHPTNNRRPEEQQATNQLLGPLQQLSQLTATDKYSSSCTKTFVKRCSMSKFDPQFGEASKAIRQLPKKPDLTMDEINELIENENLDVNSAFILYSDDRKTYKKPCPKQQKAQMNVKQMVTAHKSLNATCECEPEKEYAPMVEPDPDDLSPDVAAKMMFSQEVGIHLNACPSQTIRHLFPEDHARPRITHKSMVSVVNPSNEVEMLSKTSFSPEHGASDSAYSRMRSKGEDIGSHRSYELEQNGSLEKREYVVVAQKPARFNVTQFRGNLPSWFPGYFTAFPDQVKGMGTVGTPTAAFNRAWATSNPANIPTQDVLILES